LREITFSLNHNGIFSLIGENGAGKTTLVRILSTQLMPTSGSASIDGLDVVTQASQIRENIAAVPQEARAVPWMTPLQTITSYLMYRGYTHSDSRAIARDTLRKLGMERIEEQKNRNLSGGQKRKVLVATILSSEAELIFLDEPSTGLDYLSRKELWSMFTSMKKERSIVLTTHYLEEAEELADTIGMLFQGKLAAFGTMHDLRKLMKYPYSIKVSAPDFELNNIAGKVIHLPDGLTQIFTFETEVFDIVNSLIPKKINFTVQEVSLNTIFENIVYGGKNND
jgi:ABC-2 type transport system ATP-binding protein